jgi:hypothetical protein
MFSWNQLPCTLDFRHTRNAETGVIESTTATIKVNYDHGFQPDGPNFELIGNANRHPKDVANYETARKIALTRAMDGYRGYAANHKAYREFRTAVWDAYINRPVKKNGLYYKVKTSK